MKKLLIIFISFFILNSASATTYYVSTTGTDTPGGGSVGSPWETIQYGLDQLTGGDVLLIMNGTYNEKIEIPISNISLKNNPGHNPILDGAGLTGTVPMIEIYNVSDIIIDGLEIMNNIMNDAQGILVDENCQNVTIQNCTIHDIHFSSNINAPVDSSTNAQGIIVYGSDDINAITNLNILNNELYDCRLGYSEGIAVNGNVNGFLIEGNIVHDLTNIGIDIIGHEETSSNPANDQARNGTVKNNTIYNCVSPYATSGGLYVDGGKSIIIENNTAYHNGYGVEIGCENFGKTTDGIIVRNNVFYDNEVSALAMGGFDYPLTTGQVINSSFTNNTCYFNDYANGYVGELFLSYFDNCTIENNIFYATTQNVAMYHEGTAPINSSINYNIYYSNNLGSGIEFDYAGSQYTGVSDFNSGTTFEANGQQINPELMTPGIVTPNFHLKSNSPAINMGNPSFVLGMGEVDLDGENRLVGIVDCGVDEYNSALAVHYLEPLSVQKRNGAVFLKWTTIQEVNSHEFLIERSSGAQNWVVVKKTKATNDEGHHQYSSWDYEPLMGQSYYRVVEVDIHGTKSYSNIESIIFEKFLYHISVKDNGEYVILTNSKENVSVIVSSLNGQILYTKSHYISGNPINLKNYSTGIYIISIRTDKGVFSEKVSHFRP